MSSDQSKHRDQDESRTLAPAEQTAAGEETKRGGHRETIDGGFTAHQSVDAAAPQTVGKYVLRKLLGRGGMGAVYLGFDPLIEREVAIKVLPENLSSQSTSLKRFLAEARAVGRLNHPNAIAIYDIGEHEGRHFIVMELARGGSVSGLLEQRGRLPLAEACRITVEAARGLAVAHAAGLVHRDVKPENLMLSDDGLVKLVDFGLAKAVDRNADLAITQAGDILGTPCYMSPEQIRSEELDTRTDVYSLGATFYHLLTGEYPFQGNSIPQMMFSHLDAERPDPQKLDPSLPTVCTEVIAKAMAVDPDQRYATMDELVADLASLMQGDVDEESQHAKTATISIELTTPSILIVEPSKLRAKITADVLRAAGCDRLECVATAGEALKYAQSHPCGAVIASRQLADAQGETLLQQIRKAPQCAGAMSVLVSSDSPHELMARQPLTGTAAYARKQAAPDELLRAVHCCTSYSFDCLPFTKQEYSSLRLTLMSKDAAIPSELAGWLREFGVFDVVARTVEDVVESGLSDCSMAVWLDQSSLTEADFSARLIGPIAQTMIEGRATLAVVGATAGLRLRGVKRSAFVATCDQPFDKRCFQRLLDVA